MHELPVTTSILEIALRHAKEASAARVTDVHLVIGRLASIVDDSVQFYWDIMSAGTPAEGARLHFRRVPAQLLCLDCREQYIPAAEDFACPNCGSIQVKIVAGDEFYLDAIDVEGEDWVPA